MCHISSFYQKKKHKSSQTLDRTFTLHVLKLQPHQPKKKNKEWYSKYQFSVSLYLDNFLAAKLEQNKKSFQFMEWFVFLPDNRLVWLSYPFHVFMNRFLGLMNFFFLFFFFPLAWLTAFISQRCQPEIGQWTPSCGKPEWSARQNVCCHFCPSRNDWAISLQS